VWWLVAAVYAMHSPLTGCNLHCCVGAADVTRRSPASRGFGSLAAYSFFLRSQMLSGAPPPGSLILFSRALSIRDVCFLLPAVMLEKNGFHLYASREMKETKPLFCSKEICARKENKNVTFVRLKFLLFYPQKLYSAAIRKLKWLNFLLVSSYRLVLPLSCKK
jgi:hypothetical protein